METTAFEDAMDSLETGVLSLLDIVSVFPELEPVDTMFGVKVSISKFLELFDSLGTSRCVNVIHKKWKDNEWGITNEAGDLIIDNAWTVIVSSGKCPIDLYVVE